MRHAPRLSSSLAIALALAGCTLPGATVAPSGAFSGAADVAPASGAPGVPAPGAATQPASVAGGYLQDVWLLQGRASVDGQAPLANAELRAYDVQTGIALKYWAWDAAGRRVLPGVPRTDAEGRWHLAFLPLVGERVVRLVARSGSQTVVTLFTSRGRVLPGLGTGGAAGYRLQQTANLALNPRKLAVNPELVNPVVVSAAYVRPVAGGGFVSPMVDPTGVVQASSFAVPTGSLPADMLQFLSSASDFPWSPVTTPGGNGGNGGAGGLPGSVGGSGGFVGNGGSGGVAGTGGDSGAGASVVTKMADVEVQTNTLIALERQMDGLEARYAILAPTYSLSMKATDVIATLAPSLPWRVRKLEERVEAFGPKLDRLEGAAAKYRLFPVESEALVAKGPDTLKTLETLATAIGAYQKRLDAIAPLQPAPVAIDANTTLSAVALESGKVKFSIKQADFAKAVEQATGKERTALKEALDAIQKAIKNTTGTTFQAFASAFFHDNGTVSDAKGFSDVLSKGTSAFKASFTAILEYVDVTYESDPTPPATQQTLTAPANVFPPTSGGGGGSRSGVSTPNAPSGPTLVSSGLFTRVTGYNDDTALSTRQVGGLHNHPGDTLHDVLVDASGMVYVSTQQGTRELQSYQLGA
ncbi:MAG: hypothetical protein VKP62_01260, partial [Candidatus Sericytochromatia bacterium]|nr:hypothetical protein [Candidatus Sericytochromatia bacterium]